MVSVGLRPTLIFLFLQHELSVFIVMLQLFYSFYPSDYDSTITHLHNALEHISSWMTANLLTLKLF